MIYRIFNASGHAFDPVDTEDPAGWIAARAQQDGFSPDGWQWEASTYVEAPAPAVDPTEQLHADMAFGESLIEQFVQDGRASNMPPAIADLLDDYLKVVERRLWRGGLQDARRALAALAPQPWFPAPVRDAYIAKIDAYLTPPAQP